MRLMLLAALFSTVACTTVENDPATNSPAAYYQTRVDFAPPTRAERVTQINFEEKTWALKEAELSGKLESLRKEREPLYAAVAAKFPECRSQRHCLSFLTKGSAQRFEEYRQARGPLAQLDGQIADAESTLELWRRRRDLRVRAIYNRYLVREVLEAAQWDPRLLGMMLHSAEIFRDRQSLSRRLIQMAAPDLVPTQVGDLDFRMMGKPVDEAAVLLTLDVRVKGESGKDGRYLVSLLVNTHQLDPQVYEKGFQRAWARRLAMPEALRLETYCGLYGIASPLLLAKLGPAKAKPCLGTREALQAREAARHELVSRTEEWMLPISFRTF